MYYSKSLKFLSCLISTLLLVSCIGNMNPTGGNSAPDYPYYMTLEPMIIKKILVPKGTKLIYEEHFFKEGQQDKMLNADNLTGIVFPIDEELIWAGVPITSIHKFFNSEMRGYSIMANFDKVPADKKTKFAALWQSCDTELGILIKNNDDWSFNKKNISDVNDCSVLYQRYFKENNEQQAFLNEMYAELMKI